MNKYRSCKSILAGLLLCQAFLLLIPTYADAQLKNFVLSGRLLDKDNLRAAETVMVTAVRENKSLHTVSDKDGRFSFGPVPAGTYKIRLQSILYQSSPITIHLHKDQQLELLVDKIQRVLQEVYITASEAKGMTSTSVINRQAMQHLQPSSFTDLLELLPGGRSIDPRLTSMNQIRLREAGAIQNDYDISALGTAFLIDGAPINTTANLQGSREYFASDPNQSRNSVNKGVDMRGISTDQIERVEIVRGIPSVEYGDLTSGVIKIERKKGQSPWNARVKTDGFSKLFALSKGFSLPTKHMTINTDLGYLNAKADPTSSYENYKRINASIRAEKRWTEGSRLLKWNTALDFSTNVDNQRTDPDNSYALVDKYTSRFSSYGVTSSLRSERREKHTALKMWEISGKINYQHDKLDETKWMQTRTATVLQNSLKEGEHDVPYLAPSYVAQLMVDGKPLNAFLKATAQLDYTTGPVRHDVKLGLETNYSKNFGKGQVYDLDYPTSASMSVRPRAFDTIPGMLNQAFFAEDQLRLRSGDHEFTVAAGVRGMMLLGMNKRYALASQLYLDPRVNARWNLPAIPVSNHQLLITLGAGYGLHTKMPTLDHLYPNVQYIDIVQLNYYHNNPDFRKANVVTYVREKNNYALQAAVNRKWELNTDFALNGNRLSVTYFREKLTDGFRTMSDYNVFSYKKYDPTSVNADELKAPPATSDFAYKDAARFFSTGITANGSALLKEGIEFQFTSKRVPVVNTRFTVTGAWLNTTYINSMPLYKTNNDISVNSDFSQYVGIYDDTDGYLRERFNTNLTMDSYLPKLGLILSTAIQNMWFTASQSTWKSGTPRAYIDINGNEYPFTEESKKDPKVNYLNKPYSITAFNRYVVPIDLQVNFKATKEFKKKAAISMFVNRLFSYAPDYDSYGMRVKRSGLTSPYFGMELNFNF